MIVVLVLLVAAVIAVAVASAQAAKTAGTTEPLRLTTTEGADAAVQRVALAVGSVKKHTCSPIGPTTL